MRMWTGLCAVLVVAAIVLTGCLGVKAPPVSRPEAPMLFVDYQRTGGIAGVNDRLVIFDNGVALVSSRTMNGETQLNQSELDQISALFNGGQFSLLEGNYTSRRGGADFMQYSITYKGKTVVTQDTAIPDSLEPVIKELDRILNTGLNSGPADSPLSGIAK